MKCFWAFVVALGLCFQLGAGNVVDHHPGLKKIRLPLGDLTHICRGREEGELVAHPLDCNGYFACSRIPTLMYCDEGLQFDEDRRVCDLPDNTICRQSDSSGQGQSSLAETSELQWWPHKPRPVFVAVDVNSGEQVNPMEKYDPKDIECRHFGAYFLPHPTNCRLYFICAYGHLHRHQCGLGTRWNYEMSECQLNDQAVCYGHPKDEGPVEEVDIILGSTTPSSGAPVTVCYIVGSGGLTTLQQLLTDPETTEVSTVTVPVPPRAETSAAVNAALTCPSIEQSYMSHPEDCSKYYICIGGMPVLTSCPKGLFWDQKSGYCEMEKNVKCFQK
ncbi:hypothetical protein KR026_007267 [Drosophila bipectinata]|nr:hypothetical protein KR026_007267 [Drosophila bipectinata]